MKYCTILLVFALSAIGVAAQPNVSGLWKGSITQNQGGYRPNYDFEIYLNQKGNKISGRSYVFVDKIYAVVELSGEFTGANTIRIRESRIVDSKKTDGLEWCIKTYDLTFSKASGVVKLSGPWTGQTPSGPCIPGTVILTRKFARA
ncbi:MAG: hypothetical protein KF852_18530 [Saprospiraceae bacterium]|nr:hypothetical protein [Saprospiraceae bacterium]